MGRARHIDAKSIMDGRIDGKIYFGKKMAECLWEDHLTSYFGVNFLAAFATAYVARLAGGGTPPCRAGGRSLQISEALTNSIALL